MVIPRAPIHTVALKRLCDGTCKNYGVKKPAAGGRYMAGQARCQTCDMWIDYQGAHLFGGRPATEGSKGWFCNCCNYRVRRNPRNIVYKSKLRSNAYDAGSMTATDKLGMSGAGGGEVVAEKEEEKGHPRIDLSYFNKKRALMLRELGALMARMGRDPEDLAEGFPLRHGWTTSDIATEFDAGFGEVVRYAAGSEPNKISLIADFEMARAKAGRVPTLRDMLEHSRFDISDYKKEFKSWEHFLDRLGYDPWYRGN